MKFVGLRQIFSFRENITNLVISNGKFSLKNKLTCKAPTARMLYLSSTVKDCFTIQDKDDFNNKVLQSDIPVIVDFQAVWCGPCKTLGPRLEGIVATKENKVHLAKVDIDDNTELAIEYGVTAVPSVFGIMNGQVVDKFIGVLDDDKINSFVDQLVGPKE